MYLYLLRFFNSFSFFCAIGFLIIPLKASSNPITEGYLTHLDSTYKQHSTTDAQYIQLYNPKDYDIDELYHHADQANNTFYDDPDTDHHHHHQSNLLAASIIWLLETPHIAITALGASNQISKTKLAGILIIGTVTTTGSLFQYEMSLKQRAVSNME